MYVYVEYILMWRNPIKSTGKLLKLKRELIKMARYKISNIFLNFSSINNILIWRWRREKINSWQ